MMCSGGDSAWMVSGINVNARTAPTKKTKPDFFKSIMKLASVVGIFRSLSLLCDDPSHHVTAHVRKPKVAAGVAVGETLVVEP